MIYTSKIRKIHEAFSAGSHEKVLKLMSKILNNRIKGRVEFDFLMPNGYKTSTGDKIRTYIGYTNSGVMYYINFLLRESDYVSSFYKVSKNFKVIDGVEFDPNTNIVEVIDTIVDLINGNYEDEGEEILEVKSKFVNKNKIVEGAVEERQKIFQMWLTQSIDKNKHFNMLSKEKPSKIYKDFVLTMENEFPETIDSRFFPDSNQFVKMIREFTKSNGIDNPYIKIRKSRRITQNITLIPQTLPEEEGEAKMVVGATANIVSNWKTEFDKLQKNVDLLIEDVEYAPYGMIVWGNGGTGKSYYINQVADKMGSKAQVHKDLKNIAHLRQILFDARNLDLLVFDDADKIILDKKACTLLKTALDDTIGQRNGGIRYLPVEPKFKVKVGDPGIIETAGGLLYEFKPDVVIITNLDRITDPALWSRLYKSPIFMTKEDILDKIIHTSKDIVSKLGVNPEDARTVADYMFSLVQNETLNIYDEQISYRFYQRGLKWIKHDPMGWVGQLHTELGIGVRTSLPKMKKLGQVAK